MYKASPKSLYSVGMDTQNNNFSVKKLFLVSRPPQPIARMAPVYFMIIYSLWSIIYTKLLVFDTLICL